MITTYWSNFLQNRIYGGVAAPDLPSTYYLAISTTTPAVSGTGFTEPTTVGSAYARVQIPNNKTSFTASENGVVKTAVDFSFAESTSHWGTITYAGIFDAPTGGNLLEFIALPTTRVVEIGTILTIRAGQLEFTLGN